MTKKHLYYVEAVVEVQVILKVTGEDEQEVFARANDGAWHGVTPNWNKSKIKSIGTFTKGPGIN